jgi:predicted XRE-type DNA-binding protein
MKLIKLKIDIDVKNHDEIIRLQKGAALSQLASIFGVSKSSVEEEIKKQVKLALQKSVKEQLAQNGVKAEVSVY